MKQKRDLYLCITCLLLAFLLTMAGKKQSEEALASRIAPEILRFHVLANSNSSKDQQLKLKVRSMLLDTIYEDLGENATLVETKTYITDHQRLLEEKAESYMADQGYQYPAHIEVTDCYFPTKTYGDMVFPNGMYEAVRVEIGKAEGRNWWCVLYPPLCFTDSTYAVVPDSSKHILEEVLGEDDYLALHKGPKVKVNLRLKFPQVIKEVLEK
jgi:stage II sporulation protein R